ncbi:hypothetical protein ACIO3O_17375 [Streptomyces sp. NPDC087440]|uniref:hypothetical protein n=1 Tax=Streptomyces sp. NPDC087440 TaxID=3365790 RepID=UPI0037FD5986
MTANDTYFDRLGAALRAAGMPGDEAEATVADLTAYVADGEDVDPAEEFGGPEEFAARLTGGAPVEEPAARAEVWKWTCDLYNDRQLLNRYGDEGWEVERIDRMGRFVCRRDPSAALRWEYRREIANTAQERAARIAELAPEGWEPGGHWLFSLYFKRPKAASAGPAGGLDTLPEAPAGHVLLGVRVRRLMLFTGLMVIFFAVMVTTGVVDLSRPFFLYALPVALAVGGGLGYYGTRRDARRGVADPEK